MPDKRPQIISEAFIGFKRKKGLGIANSAVDFQFVADNASITKKLVNFFVTVLRDQPCIKSIKCLSIVFPFSQNGNP